MSTTAPYLLGHSDAETRRLNVQAELVNPMTRRMFVAAGLRPGMRVLDVGCGSGAVARLAAEMVGPTGRVTTVEANPDMMEVARATTENAGIGNVSFVRADLTDPDGYAEIGANYDAVVGRFILFFMPDPAEVIRRLAAAVRPGGSVAFHEPAHTPPVAFPRSTVLDQIWGWISELYRQRNLDMNIGLRLFRLFADAGLPGPELDMGAFIGGGPDWPGYDLMASLIRTIGPLIKEHGLASPDELDPDKIASRLREHTISHHGVMASWTFVTAWARKP